MKKESRILKNILYAFAAQGISLLLSMLSAFILPKFFDKLNYGYWSLFLFYTGYTGFFHFGLNDGVYLKIGGTEYKDMDKDMLGAQFKFGALFQSIIGIVLAAAVFFFCKDENTTFALIMTLVYMLLYNLTLYLGAVFQAANETRLYSVSVMIDKLIFMAALLLLFVVGDKDFKLFVWLYLFAKLVALIYCVYKGKEIVFSKHIPVSDTIKEAMDSIKIGINLTIANIAGNLILGVGRQMVEWRWDIEGFADFSFALTLTNFFLLFITQISMVLFPALRQVDEEKQKVLFEKAKNGLNILLPVVFLVYIPAKAVLQLWLPDYAVSLKYMALLLPMCIFDGKMNLVCATYFKVLRKERFLLGVNLFSMALSVVLSYIAAYILNDMNAIVLFMVVSIGARYFISERFLERMYTETGGMKSFYVQAVEEIILSAVCVAACWYAGFIVSLVIVLVVYAVYLWLNRESVHNVYDMVITKLKK